MAARKTVVVAPTLPTSAKLTRFHSDATDAPLYTVVTWTSRYGKSSSSGGASVARKRQLMVETATQRLLEVQRIGASKDKNRSWFIDNHVQQDGSLVVLTPMDPLFVLLHAVIDQKERYLSTYDLLSNDHNVWWFQLGNVLTQAKIELICDVQFTGDDAIDNLYVRVNEEKLIKWLSTKIERVATTLAAQAATVANTGAFDAKFVLPGQTPKDPVLVAADGEITPEVVKKFHRDAIDVIADYLPPRVVPLMYKHYNISSEAATSTSATASAAAAAPVDAIRRFDRRAEPAAEGNATTPAKRPANGNSASSASAKKKSKLANVDRTGMKSLSSFFGIGKK